MTPYEIWHRKDPKLSYLRVWGCEARRKQKPVTNLDSKSIKCIFVSYHKETIGYYFYYTLKNKIFISRNAEFFENSFMVQEASEGHRLLEMSGSDKGLEIIQEEDTQPSENTSKEHNEVPRCIVWLDYDEHVDSLSTMDNKVGVTSPESTIQTLPSFEEYTPLVTYPEEVEKNLGTPIEVEPLSETKLEEVGLNCNHNTPFSSREVPSFDGLEP
ncbi:retrovirus-related pol polyprotein from transposon TNT 1-94 [Tanacetum coccineum]